MNHIEQRNDRIGRGRTLVDLLVIVAAAIVFNLFPQNVGVLVSATDPSSFITTAGVRVSIVSSLAEHMVGSHLLPLCRPPSPGQVESGYEVD